MGWGKVRIELESPANCDGGGVHPAEFDLRCTQVVVCFGRLRVEFKGAGIAGDGFLQPAEGPIRFAKMAMRCGVRRVEGDCTAYPLRRKLVLTSLVGGNPKKVQRAGVIWLHLQDLLVKLPGLGQATGAMVLKCKFKGLWNGHENYGWFAHQSRHIAR